MAIKTGISHATIEKAKGVTFTDASSALGLPSGNAIDAALEYEIEPDIEDRTGVTLTSTNSQHVRAATRYTIDWVVKWIYDNKGGAGEATAQSFGGSSVSFATPPKCPSNATIRYLRNLRDAPEVEAVTD